MARIDTRLEAEGAEYLVLGTLLVRKICAFKAYRNTKGHDIIAFDLSRRNTLTIQVKSRWQTGANAFFLRKIEAEIVVYCQLNRGSRDGSRSIKEPVFYVLPAAVIRDSKQPEGKVYLNRIADREQYRNAWGLITKALQQ